MADNSEATAVKLKSKQEEVFEVEKEVACRAVTVKNMVDDTGLDTPVPLPTVDSKILIKVVPLHSRRCPRRLQCPQPIPLAVIRLSGPPSLIRAFRARLCSRSLSIANTTIARRTSHSQRMKKICGIRSL
mmetsp:Transcript_9212/g.30487  ORF Transcript_9212/g.30487 Transcript_9212/m.30487 type:complete len:130 (+) Transcript_9212:72-461(+)